MVDINGTCDPRFDEMRSIMAANIESGADVGASAAVVLDGELVVVDPRRSETAALADWLAARQQADGGWGETADSYHRPELRGIGPSTAAQTAWALMAIFSTGDYYSESAVRGVKYLLDHQRDGGWEDVTWTGTGFPKVFYLKYHLYLKYH